MLLTYLPLLLTILIPVQPATIKNEEHEPALKNALFSQSKTNEKPSESAEQEDIKPHDDTTKDLHLDLSDFSDDELIRLAEVLQQELKDYEKSETSISELAAEPLVLIPSEFTSRQPKQNTRPRRSKPHGKVMLAHSVPAELLQRLTQAEPIIVLPEMDNENPQNGPTYLTVKASAKQSSMPLTAAEIDDYELRSRIAQLADLLRERALRDL